VALESRGMWQGREVGVPGQVGNAPVGDVSATVIKRTAWQVPQHLRRQHKGDDGTTMPSNWNRATPEAAGFAANLERKLAAGFESGLLLPIHALLVARTGKLVLEQYFEGEDETWGDTLGRVQFGPEVLHDLRSVTKSIVGLLYGIALERGLVPPLQAPVIDGFPGDQRFFIAYAQTWATKMRDEALRARIATDGHAPGNYRALTVRNLDAWYKAFNVQPTDKLYLAPDQRVRVWG